MTFQIDAGDTIVIYCKIMFFSFKVTCKIPLYQFKVTYKIPLYQIKVTYKIPLYRIPSGPSKNSGIAGFKFREVRCIEFVQV